MGKVAELLIKVRADDKEARKVLQNAFAVAANGHKAAEEEAVKATRNSAAARKRIEDEFARHQQRTNQVSLSDYKQYLDRRLGEEKEFSRRWMSLLKERDRAQEMSDRAKRRGGPITQAILTSRFGAPGGGAQPLVGRTAAAFGLSGTQAAVAAGVAGVGAVAASFALSQGKRALDIAGDLQQSMNVLQQQSGATNAQLQEMIKTARDLGAAQDLPATSSLDAAHAMLELAKAGLQVKDAQDGARGSLELAAAAEIDAGEAANITAGQLQAFHLQGKEAGRVADLLAAAAQNSLGDITDMAQASQQAATAFAAAKMPIEDMTTAISLLANAGIKGSDAGTSLRVMLSRLTAPTDEAKKVFKGLGIEVYDSQGRVRDFRDIIGQFQTKLQGATDEQKKWVAQTVFGEDAQRAFNVILDGGVGKFDAMKKKVTEAGAAAKTAQAKSDGYKGAIEGLNSAVDTFLEKHGAKFLNFFEAIIRKTSGALDGLDKFIDRIGEAQEADKKWRTEQLKREMFSFIPFGTAKNARDLGTQAGMLRVQRRILGEELYRAQNGSYPAVPLDDGGGHRALTNVLNDRQRGQILERYGLKDATPPQIQAAIAQADKQLADLDSKYNRAKAQETSNKFLGMIRGALGDLGPDGAKKTPAGGNKKIADLMNKKGGGKKRSAEEIEAERVRSGQAEQAKADAEELEYRLNKRVGQYRDYGAFQTDDRRAAMLKEIDDLRTQLLAKRGNQFDAEAAIRGDAKSSLVRKARNQALTEEGDRTKGSIDEAKKSVEQAIQEARARHAQQIADNEKQRLETEKLVLEAQERNLNFSLEEEKDLKQRGIIREAILKTQEERLEIERRLADAAVTEEKAALRAKQKGKLTPEQEAGFQLRYKNNKEAFTNAYTEGIQANTRGTQADDREAARDAADVLREEIQKAIGRGDFSAARAALEKAQAKDVEAAGPLSDDQKKAMDARHSEELAELTQAIVEAIRPLLEDRQGGSETLSRLARQRTDALQEGVGELLQAGQGAAREFVTALMSGEGEGDKLSSLAKSLGQEIAGAAADGFTHAVIDAPLQRVFSQLGDRLSKAIAAGGVEAGQNILQGASALMAAAGMLAGSGKKKRGGLFGAILGGIVGSLVPGVGWLAGLGIGSNLGQGNYTGALLGVAGTSFFSSAAGFSNVAKGAGGGTAKSGSVTNFKRFAAGGYAEVGRKHLVGDPLGGWANWELAFSRDRVRVLGAGMHLPTAPEVILPHGASQALMTAAATMGGGSKGGGADRTGPPPGFKGVFIGKQEIRSREDAIEYARETVDADRRRSQVE